MKGAIPSKAWVILKNFGEEEKIVKFFSQPSLRKERDYSVAAKALTTQKVFESAYRREVPTKIIKYLFYRCGIKRSMYYYYLYRYKPTIAYDDLLSLYDTKFSEFEDTVVRVSVDLKDLDPTKISLLREFIEVSNCSEEQKQQTIKQIQEWEGRLNT